MFLMPLSGYCFSLLPSQSQASLTQDRGALRTLDINLLESEISMGRLAPTWNKLQPHKTVCRLEGQRGSHPLRDEVIDEYTQRLLLIVYGSESSRMLCLFQEKRESVVLGRVAHCIGRVGKGGAWSLSWRHSGSPLGS